MATIQVCVPVILLTFTLLVVIISGSELSSLNKSKETYVNYEGSEILRIHGMSRKNMNHIHQLEDKGVLELLGGSILAIEILVLKDKKDIAKQMLKDANMEFGVVMDDVNKIINITSVQYVAQSSCSKGSCLTWTKYHRLEDIYKFLEYIEEMYPEFVTVEDIGVSAEQRALKLVKVSNGNNASKSIWIDGGIHAREWISPASVTFILNELVEKFAMNDSTYSDLNFYFMPLMNPDGYEYSHTMDRFWRKNRAHNVDTECIGTDLNRNWGYGWGSQRTSNDPCSLNFPGLKPFSEKETSSVSEYIKNIPNLKGYVTYHSYGQYVLFPWAHTYARLPDYADLLRVGVNMAKEINKTTGTIYKVGTTADKLYTASGGSDDWARGAAEIKYSYTIELQDTGDFGFLLPPEKIAVAASDAYAVFKILVEQISMQ